MSIAEHNTIDQIDSKADAAAIARRIRHDAQLLEEWAVQRGNIRLMRKTITMSRDSTQSLGMIERESA